MEGIGDPSADVPVALAAAFKGYVDDGKQNCFHRPLGPLQCPWKMMASQHKKDKPSQTAYLSLRVSRASKDLGLIKKRSSAKFQHLLQRERLDLLESILQQTPILKAPIRNSGVVALTIA